MAVLKAVLEAVEVPRPRVVVVLVPLSSLTFSMCLRGKKMF